MSHKLLILAQDKKKYHALIEEAQFDGLEIVDQPADDVDIVLGEPSLIKTALASVPALIWAQSIWAGIEPLVGPASRRDYILTNARGVFGELMSEYVIGYLLAHERKIFQRHEAQMNKQWEDSDTGTLRGKTIGLLGVGSIGAEVALTAKFFGMNVRGYTRDSEISAHVDSYFHGDDLLKFASGLDYLVNILPNTKDTRKIINADLLHVLPSHALVINVGRGPAVDESALLDALNQNKIAGAVLDVFEQEPLPKDHPFWTTPNLLMTFHTAAPSLAEDITNIFIENYELLLEDKPLKYRVDFEKGY
ncbi:D-2-hydroxyacid dehydrogenase [Candidatus Villigracilis saccharophilus]|uniref:D-2-hydroxyacid dehydrogenase n=1 Tax=Candidatus Villigracilis saccharophilus TaxID=3140684 RepID=UPI003136C265|nr:D-2-hydroxyacid dehydrogenase [Anaerolineales bacterium]